MLYELYFNLNTLVATVQNEELSAVAGSFKLGTFHHDDPVDEPLTENHVIYHHVRDMLYKAGYENMQIIKIVMTPSVA